MPQRATARGHVGAPVLALGTLPRAYSPFPAEHGHRRTLLGAAPFSVPLDPPHSPASVGLIRRLPLILNAVARAAGTFSIADLQRECPGVSVDMIRHVLKKLGEKGQVECLGRGRSAVWKKTSG
jgi:hypothetical protein